MIKIIDGIFKKSVSNFHAMTQITHYQKFKQYVWIWFNEISGFPEFVIDISLKTDYRVTFNEPFL